MLPFTEIEMLFVGIEAGRFRELVFRKKAEIAESRLPCCIFEW